MFITIEANIDSSPLVLAPHLSHVGDLDYGFDYAYE